MQLVHTCANLVTSDPRILRARDTWKVLHDDFDWLPAPMPHPYPRSSLDLGDTGNCPYLLDMLAHARKVAGPDAYVVLTSDDVILKPGIDVAVRVLLKDRILISGQRADVDLFDEAMSTRADRLERNNCGRVLFGFAPEVRELPDLIMGPAVSDLCLTAMARLICGLPWTLKLSSAHEPCCEVPAGYLFHERHRSSWLEPGLEKSNAYNASLTAAWFRQNMPESIPDYLKGL